MENIDKNKPVAPAIEALESVEALWGVSRQPAGCPRCRQVYLVATGSDLPPCPNCFQARLEAQPALLRAEPPEKVLPFRFDRQGLLPALTAFTSGVWLAPDDFTPSILTQRLTPVFFPLWLVDADINAAWQAEAGYDYQVSSSQEVFSGGWQTRKVIENRVRWEPRAGELTRHYDNASAPACSDNAGVAAQTGGYDFSKAEAYAPARIGGAALRVPDIQPQAAWPLAQSALSNAAAEEVRQACEAQHIRLFQAKAQFGAVNWTQMLLPLYATYYTADDGERVVVLVNGQTGKVGGLRLSSQAKGTRIAGISAAIGALVLLVGIALAVIGASIAPVAAIGGLLIVAGIGALLFAIVPAAYPWQHNRNQRPRKVVG